MPAPSLIFSACFPLASTTDVVRPATFHRGSFPTAVRSRLSGDCAPARIAIHESAISHSLAFLMLRASSPTIRSFCGWGSFLSDVACRGKMIGRMSIQTFGKLERKAKRSYALSPESVAFLEAMRKKQQSKSISAILDGILQTLRREHELASIERAVAASYG